MMGAIVEFERDLINEGTKEGRERAKAQGKHLGRKGQDIRALKGRSSCLQNGFSIFNKLNVT